ncbi:MAG: Cobalt-precorrin-6A reductase [Cyanobacteriota bacterium]|jgi:precorrin-6A/cobalt-precorrin-6A reductase
MAASEDRLDRIEALIETLEATPRLWLIGGTREAVDLAQALIAAAIPCVVTVTTTAAQRAYPQHPNLWVEVGALDLSQLADFIRTHDIGAILDASHPFAVAISQGAMAQAATLGLPYWRYERPLTTSQGEPKAHGGDPGGYALRRVPHLEAALTPEILAGQRVLLTLGYRWLAAFQPWQERATLFARILPSSVALEAALAAGFGPERLIALRPPIDEPLEQALWQQWQITTVITKASGQPGGEETKQAVAARLGVALVIIDRPTLNYPTMSHDTEEILARCREWWQEQKSPATFESIRYNGRKFG